MNLFGFLILGFLLSCTNCYANWQNPSERYANVYKKYAQARCPIPENKIKHFVYFARDRGAIKGHSLLKHDRFRGAQIMYLWPRLEPAKGKYDFSIISHDYEYLKNMEKNCLFNFRMPRFIQRSEGFQNI